jgi:hypothetical protein
MLHTPLVMRPGADQKVPVDFVMDNRTTAGIKISRTPDVIPIKRKVMTEKEPDLTRFVFKVHNLDFFDIDVQIQIYYIRASELQTQGLIF